MCSYGHLHLIFDTKTMSYSWSQHELTIYERMQSIRYLHFISRINHTPIWEESPILDCVSICSSFRKLIILHIYETIHPHFFLFEHNEWKFILHWRIIFDTICGKIETQTFGEKILSTKARMYLQLEQIAIFDYLIYRR